MNKEHYIPEYAPNEWHAVYTIQLGQLIQCGEIDFNSDSWHFNETEHIKNNEFWAKFEKRFYWREIGILPYGKWHWELMRRIEDLLPKYEKSFCLPCKRWRYIRGFNRIR